MNMIIHKAKRAISMIVAAVMAAGLITGVPLPAFSAGGTWTGDGLSEATAFEIADAQDLARLAADVNGGESYEGKYFKLTEDIDLSSWITENGEEEGWTPIGTMERPFAGNFDGNGKNIDGLWINKPDLIGVGLFGAVKDNTISNMHITAQDNNVVNGYFYVGVLAGFASGSTIRGCTVSGTVAGTSIAGGLIGYQHGGAVGSCRFSGTVSIPQDSSSNEYAGGLVAYQQIDALIENSSAKAEVSGYQQIGGLIGGSAANQCTVRDCYAEGTVSGYSQIGGLAGHAESLLMERCYSASIVTGTYQYVGGLIGYNNNYTLRDCYAVGAVNGGSYVGGLIGIQSSGEKIIENCYAAGNVSANGRIGGFIGEMNTNYPSILTNNFFDTSTTMQEFGVGNNAQTAGISGKTTSEMKLKSTFENWNFDGGSESARVWYMQEGTTYPLLGISIDYALNGIPGSWSDSGTVRVENDGDELAILADAGPQTPVLIYIDTPEDARFTITVTGRQDVTYENLYLYVRGENTTLNLTDLKITAPEGKNGIYFYANNTHEQGEEPPYAKLNVNGKCAVQGGDGDDEIYNNGIVVSSLSLTISGDTLQAQGGNSSTKTGGAGIASFNGLTTFEADNLFFLGGNGIENGGDGLKLNGPIQINSGVTEARGGKGANGAGGAGAYIKFAATINGGELIAYSGEGNSPSSGIKTGGELEISNNSVVKAMGTEAAIFTTKGAYISGSASVTAEGNDGGHGIYSLDGIYVSENPEIKSTGGSSEHGNGGTGIYSRKREIKVDSGQITASGGDGVQGGYGIYSDEQIRIIDGDVTTNGGKSQIGTTGARGTGLLALSLNVSGGSLSATGGDGIQSGGSDSDIAGLGIYALDEIILTGGTTAAYGGTANYGGHGLMTANKGITVSNGANLEVIGGTGAKSTGGDGMSVGYSVITTDESASRVTIDETAGNVYIRGGKNSEMEEASAVNARYVYVSTGNIRRIDVPQGGVIKNEPDGDDVYMLTADISPVVPDVVFQSIVPKQRGEIYSSYTYSAPGKADGIAYMWLPAGMQTVSASGYGNGEVQVLNNASAVTLYSDFNITINYKEGDFICGTKNTPASLGSSLELEAPQGYELRYGISNSLTLDPAIMVNGIVGGCTITAAGKDITVDVPVMPVEIVLTLNCKTEDGTIKGTQEFNIFYNGIISEGYIALPAGYALSDFKEFLLNTDTPDSVIDLKNRTATASVTVKPLDYTVTVVYFEGTAFAGQEYITAPYDSDITEFTPAAGYETAPGTTVTVDSSLEPDHSSRTANKSIQVTKKDYSVHITYTGAGTTQIIEGKQLGGSIFYSELKLPEGYSTDNFGDIYIDSDLAATAEDGVIKLDVPVSATDIVVTIKYQNADTVVGTQALNMAKGEWITADMLLIPFGYEMMSFNSTEVKEDLSLDMDVSITPAQSVTVQPGQMILTLDKDREDYINAEISPSRILDSTVTWESSDPNVAVVDAYGRVSPVSKGNVIIKAVSNQTNSVFGECMVTVVEQGYPYVMVLPYQKGWNRQPVTLTMDIYADSDHIAERLVSAKYKVTESAEMTEYIDDGSWTEYTEPFTLDTDGTHYVHWYAENGDGLSTQGVSNAVGIDTVPPEITNAKVSASSTSQIDLTAQASDAGSGIAGYAWYLVQDGKDMLISTSPEYSHTDLKANTNYSYKLTVTDVAGNRSERTLEANTGGSTSGGGGLGIVTSYTVTFDSNGGSKVEKQNVGRYKTAVEPDAPEKDGFIFTGWYADNELTKKYDFSTAVVKNITLYAGWEENTTPTSPPVDPNEWFEPPFVSGYPDGSFRPDNEISRAEVARIIYNLFSGGSPADMTVLDDFSDIDASHWAAEAIAWSAGRGYIKGYPDGTVRPDTTITRAELAALLERVAKEEKLFDDTKTEQFSFADAEGHWAYEAILLLAGMDVIQGYPDGTFMPEKSVTRAETVMMISRLLKRSSGFLQDKSFNDVDTGHWAYRNIMNAANGVKRTA